MALVEIRVVRKSFGQAENIRGGETIRLKPDPHPVQLFDGGEGG